MALRRTIRSIASRWALAAVLAAGCNARPSGEASTNPASAAASAAASSGSPQAMPAPSAAPTAAAAHPIPAAPEATAAVTLVETAYRALERRAPRTLVRVARTGIEVDAAPLVASWPESDKARLARAGLDVAGIAARRIVVPMSDFVPPPDAAPPEVDPFGLIPLAKALEQIANLERARLAPPPLAHEPEGKPDEADLDMDLVVDRDAPARWAIAAQILGQSAGFGRYHLVVRGPEGEGSIPLVAPPVLSGAPEKPPDDACASPALLLTPIGIMVVLGLGLPSVDIIPQPTGTDLRRWAVMEAFEKQAQSPHGPKARSLLELASSVPPPRWAKWYGKVVVPHDKRCPSIRLVDGAYDLAALGPLLRKAAAVAPGCGAARVRPELDTKWSDLIAVVVATLEEGVFPRVFLAAPDPRSDAGSGDCSDAIVAPKPARGR